ncbi:pilus assembly protein CpaB [Rhodopseudomonas thermotolerans]|uniref:Pilus assembly protein CpaB n=2 Tax=Rhodopseudomonas TaxID=1073 RepID=A0A336JRD0_9BRAD|nr:MULTISPECIES: Flp pilus assembly protein CpaB [Rhodopseudomonas]RED30587.1 pilus assembly protein CpaB [Rhodopseudomonas pentothenatexigens]REF92691.1 pilus assembly protein CpaB [Rhodopseudomonas thermotolerans]SSW92120.1 pilus assembly protein CpaB [Rhodopseudomonas pentothenatexigens]
MNTARIVVLTIAVGAGGVAAYLASSAGPQPSTPTESVAQLETVEVLVAKNDIPLGQAVAPGDLQWQTWPAATASSNFIRRNDQPNATSDIVGSIARSPFIAGEPIREQKLVKADGSGFMAAILPSGMRAISTEISPETGAGGFILPNDRVDVILSKREKNPDNPSGDRVNSEIILGNVRVLAIDQTIEEKNGQKVVVGKTATLELKPEQAEFLARARQSGTLSLALRSLADASQPATTEHDAKRDTVNVIRYGVTTQTSSQK